MPCFSQHRKFYVEYFTNTKDLRLDFPMLHQNVPKRDPVFPFKVDRETIFLQLHHCFCDNK